MKPHFLLAASALALAVAACGSKTPPARASLDCPATQGDLTRTGVAPDGKSCTYVTNDGAEVSLQLVSVQGGVSATLQRLEDSLLADREPAEAVPAKDVEVTGEAAEASAEAARVATEQAQQDAQNADVTVKVAGRDAVVTEDGGTTRVDLPGIHIVADDEGDTADVRVGPIRINAGGDNATFRVGPRDVRLKGESLSPEKRGVRATFVYTGKDLPEGYRLVGYEAGGPKTGPLTVATVKSKLDSDHSGEIYPDVQKLVRRNGGV